MAQENFDWSSYVKDFSAYLMAFASQSPWQLTSKAPEIVSRLLSSLSSEYKIHESVAIHKSAVIENNIALKGPIIIGPNCFVAANCYIRGGVFLIGQNSIGPGCELKSSFLFPLTQPLAT